MTNVVSVVIQSELLKILDKKRSNGSRSKFICRLLERELMEENQ